MPTNTVPKRSRRCVQCWIELSGTMIPKRTLRKKILQFLGVGPVKRRVFSDLFNVRVKGLSEKEEDVNLLFHSELLVAQHLINPEMVFTVRFRTNYHLKTHKSFNYRQSKVSNQGNTKTQLIHYATHATLKHKSPCENYNFHFYDYIFNALKQQ